MKYYTVHLDMSQIITEFKEFQLREFNYSFPKIRVYAKDPDDACYVLYTRFATMILGQRNDTKTKNLIDETKYNMSIVKIDIDRS